MTAKETLNLSKRTVQIHSGRLPAASVPAWVDYSGQPMTLPHYKEGRVIIVEPEVYEAGLRIGRTDLVSVEDYFTG